MSVAPGARAPNILRTIASDCPKQRSPRSHRCRTPWTPWTPWPPRRARGRRGHRRRRALPAFRSSGSYPPGAGPPGDAGRPRSAAAAAARMGGSHQGHGAVDLRARDGAGALVRVRQRRGRRRGARAARPRAVAARAAAGSRRRGASGRRRRAARPAVSRKELRAHGTCCRVGAGQAAGPRSEGEPHAAPQGPGRGDAPAAGARARPAPGLAERTAYLPLGTCSSV